MKNIWAQESETGICRLMTRPLLVLASKSPILIKSISGCFSFSVAFRPNKGPYYGIKFSRVTLKKIHLMINTRKYLARAQPSPRSLCGLWPGWCGASATAFHMDYFWNIFNGNDARTRSTSSLNEDVGLLLLLKAKWSTPLWMRCPTWHVVSKSD